MLGNSKLKTEFIDFLSAEYFFAVELRDLILRKPLGLEFSKEYLMAEKDDYHLNISLEEKVLACCVLSPKADNRLKMKQVAVAQEHQKTGLGSILIKQTIDLARKKEMKSVYCHARITAVEFYKKHDFKIASELFTEVGIEHYIMEFEIE